MISSRSNRIMPPHGERKGPLETWRPIHQIATTAERLGENVKVLFLPYGDVSFSPVKLSSNLNLETKK